MRGKVIVVLICHTIFLKKMTQVLFSLLRPGVIMSQHLLTLRLRILIHFTPARLNYYVKYSFQMKGVYATFSCVIQSGTRETVLEKIIAPLVFNIDDNFYLYINKGNIIP